MFAKIKEKLAGLLATTDNMKEEAEKRPEDRNYERFNLPYNTLAYVRTKQGLILPLTNISYGGFATNVVPNPLVSREEAENMETETGTLSFLELSVPTSIKLVHCTPKMAGYTFIHREPKALIFLREVIESLRNGQSLRAIKKEFLKEEFQNPQWFCVRGEGPTDLLLRRNAEGELLEFIMTSRSGEHYYEWRLHNGRLSTGRVTNQNGPSAQVTSHTSLDVNTVRLMTQILLGIRDESLRTAFRPLLAEGYKALEIELPE